MRAVAILYNWSENSAGVGSFEAFLTAGNFLSREHLKNLASELQWRRRTGGGDAPDGQQTDCPVAGQTYNVRLSAIRHFLKWAYEPKNHGGTVAVDQDEIHTRIRDMKGLLEEETVAVREPRRHEPLTFDEIKLIRRAIGPNKFGEFSPGVFSESTRYRNWIMFEMALNLGVRKGELLTLKVEHLSRGKAAQQIYVPRQQDAVEDPRTRRRLRGKTVERFVPLMNPNCLPKILEYRDAEPPLGRSGHASPYLFLTAAGQPVSNSTADYVIKQIGKYAERTLDEDETLDIIARERCKESLQNLSWHRLRHTWAEIAALYLYDTYNEGAWAILRDWGGWRRTDSMERYIKYTRHRIAEESGVRYINARTFRSDTHDGAEYAGRASA
jgi:integrase